MKLPKLEKKWVQTMDEVLSKARGGWWRLICIHPLARCLYACRPLCADGLSAAGLALQDIPEIMRKFENPF